MPMMCAADMCHSCLCRDFHHFTGLTAHIEGFFVGGKLTVPDHQWTRARRSQDRVFCEKQTEIRHVKLSGYAPTRIKDAIKNHDSHVPGGLSLHDGG
jgi:hypothetical protein